MKLSLFQMDAALEGPARRAAIEEGVREAASAGSALALFPELAVEGYGTGEAMGAAAPAPEELATSPLQHLAGETGMAICAGMALRRHDGALSNAAVLFRPGHAPLAYAKRQLYGAYEKALFRPGTAAAPLAEWAGLRLGLLVCFDVEFPEQVRELALAGADLVLVPTALPQGPGARFIAQSMVPTRAFEDGIFLAYADHCGSDARFSYQGLSSISAPDGSRLAAATAEATAHLSATIDPHAYDEAREANPYLRIARAMGA
ncbi:nitrilase-related carbon-nitrogen hydrolase [Aureimonas populi]|uniref:Nitrilase-related carbon-nitrogen hydrolase n=1 Tax=Aureimonas populi TaxID=1701758 RepID=A0ABW5CMB0_9HYPH|nr:nitrilase-related carbon-nitrogen hydrolase [Aureimonas populi]